MDESARLALVGGRVVGPFGAGGGLGAVDGVNVVIEGERIAGLETEPPLDARVVDVSGLTVLPGLVELHTHVPTPAAMALFVRQGVTSVRFAGTALGVAAGVRRLVEGGELAGPRIFSCGPILDEPPAAWADVSVTVTDPGEGRAAAGRLIDAEADALLVAQRVRPATLAVIAGAAHERGVPVTGQNWTTSVREAIQAGIDGIENTARLPEDPSLGSDWVEGYTSIGHRLARLAWLWRTAPQGPIDEVLGLMVERGIDWAPEVCSFASWAGFTDHPLTELRGYVPPSADERAAIAGHRARTAEGWTDEDRDNARAAIERIQQALAAYHRLGGHLGVGTDAHPGGLFYHLELGYYAAAGLSNAEVIAAATTGGARALRRSADLGTIERGKLADLIVVDGDPLADLGALQRVRYALVGGRLVVEDGQVR